MRPLGKTLQLFGLVFLPLAIVMQMGEAISLGQMLMMMVAGATSFWLGRLLEGYATP